MTIEHFYDSIPGWFNFDDLYREQIYRVGDGAVFVEVGSWLGRSAAFMAVEIANSGKPIDFYAVDTWKGSPAPQYQAVLAEHGGSVYDAFLQNLRRAPVVVCPLRGDSVEIAHSFNDDDVDFVFLDAAHDFHGVRRDVHAWLPKVKVGGTIAGHDANCPGLMNAVREFIPGSQISYSRTSWRYTVPTSPIHTYTHRCLAKLGISMPSVLVSTVGIWDDSLGELAIADYLHRSYLAGHAGATAVPPTNASPTDLELYLEKWGGPPGAERFTFPYGVTTLDW